MNPLFLDHYNRELQYLRELGGEFAEEFPKIAGRLGLNAFECADPYVERLLEGFAFLAARVQLKVDAGYPRFTQHLLEMVYPHYLAPVPSMAIVQLTPDINESSLQNGVVIPRGSQLRSRIGKGEQTACEYRTAHEVTLWPLQLYEAEYLAGASAVANLGVAGRPGLKAGLRLRLRTTAGLQFNHLDLDRLTIFLRGGEAAVALYEQFAANLLDVVLLSGQKPNPKGISVGAQALRPQGFEDRQALLPTGPRSFRGYRFLQEYFALPERYLFMELTGLQPAVRRCEHGELDLVFLFDRSNPKLAEAVDVTCFNLFCTPAINLFEKRADRIHPRGLRVSYRAGPNPSHGLRGFRGHRSAGLRRPGRTGKRVPAILCIQGPILFPPTKGLFYPLPRTAPAFHSPATLRRALQLHRQRSLHLPGGRQGSPLQQ
jgi:type VI secretion system protein ImpG